MNDEGVMIVHPIKTTVYGQLKVKLRIRLY
uniref:Uncharacterized protein n=1 Tax=Rhizophora mucronata TaxID=61149 RepID=A0A2P2QHL8_RHIMU